MQNNTCIRYPFSTKMSHPRSWGAKHLSTAGPQVCPDLAQRVPSKGGWAFCWKESPKLDHFSISNVGETFEFPDRLVMFDLTWFRPQTWSELLRWWKGIFYSDICVSTSMSPPWFQNFQLLCESCKKLKEWPNKPSNIFIKNSQIPYRMTPTLVTSPRHHFGARFRPCVGPLRRWFGMRARVSPFVEGLCGGEC